MKYHSKSCSVNQAIKYLNKCRIIHWRYTKHPTWCRGWLGSQQHHKEWVDRYTEIINLLKHDTQNKRRKLRLSNLMQFKKEVLMGIEMSLENNLNCPRIKCDICKKFIDHSNEGNYEWDWEHTKSRFVHKECSYRSKDTFPLSISINEFIGNLMHNVRFDKKTYKIETERLF